ncbi:unnamed protein product [Urochloa decumbens]|uniref:4-coumarate--CoA ligase n=1 Tax=Urochloa decumbens TaxID=240449 RepID=A0ABC9B2Z5_9POAL
MLPPPAGVDPHSGYCAATRTFHSLRPPPPTPIPPPDRLLSFPAAAFSLLHTHFPSHPALIDSATGETLHFPSFLSRVRALATALRSELRVTPGDVAFVLAPAGVHVPVLYYALMSIGAVVSPANPALTAGEISSLASLSNPSIAFTVRTVAGKIPTGLTTVLLDSPRFLSFISQDPHCHGDGGDGVVAAGEDAVVIQQSDPAAILYSSGTTGRAKAVVMTHRNLITMASTPGVAKVAEAALLTVPMFHVFGFVFCLRAVLVAQTLVLYTARRFNARDVLNAVSRFQVTTLALAPPALLAIVRAAEDDSSVVARTTTLQAVICGGAAIAPELVRRFSLEFPDVCLFQGYGLTETTAGFCRVIGVEESKRTGSVGRLSWGAEAKIVHRETGAALPPGMPGELWVRGHFVMKGYLGEKDATSAILNSEGWLRTGDLCCIDEDGFIYIVDRLKDLIKYKGFQVAPAELENLLQTHPDIDEAAVVPYPDYDAGEVPVAFVVRRSGSKLHEGLIKEYVAKQVVYYKRIHHVFLVASIPKNAAGKILRKDLVKLALHQISSKL